MRLSEPLVIVDRVAREVFPGSPTNCRPVTPLAWWCLGASTATTVGANLAHDLGHGPIGALVSA
jgi:hypothetical protein